MTTQVAEGFRLSPQQRYVWSQQFDDASMYCSQATVLIEGLLDVHRLDAALSDVVNRHESFRSVFHQLPAVTMPILVIASESSIGWGEIQDLSDQQPAEQEQTISALLQNARAGFDLEQGPLFRVALLKLAAEKHLLVLTAHALCADRTSLEQIAHQIATAYAPNTSNGHEVTPPLQYPEFTTWHNDLLESPDSEADRAYWQKLVEPALLEPAALLQVQAPTAAATGIERLTLKLEAKTVAALATLAQSQNQSLETILQTSWQLLLWRLCGQQEMVVGVAHPGRLYDELVQAVGLFEKYLPIASDLEAGTSFNAAAQLIHQLNQEASEQVDYFNPDSIAQFETGSSAAFLPLCFEAITAPAPYQAGSVTFQLTHQYICTSPFNLKLTCIMQGQNLSAEYYFNTAALSVADVQRLAGYFQTFLHNIVQNPDAAIDTISFLTEAEQQQLLAASVSPTTPYPRDTCVAQLFEEQVSRTPNAVAVAYQGETLTYAELNGRANQLARYLQQRGVGPEVLVAVCAERSTELVVALLGVLKAGGAYLPLDSSYPQNRLAFLLQETKAPVILTQERLVATLPDHQAELVCLDTAWPTIAQESAEPLAPCAQPENLAYLIYTSGTTGVPNGVMITQRGLVNYLSWCTEAYNLAAGNGSLVHSSIGFDLTITSLFAPLLVGQKVILLPEDRGVGTLAATLREGNDYSLVKLTPTHLRLLNQLLADDDISGRVRTMVIGGEDLRGEHIAFFHSNAPTTRIVNEYGPTETVVGCSAYTVTTTTAAAARVPIGLPIANAQIYILDAHGSPLPPGVPGEIYIGGDGVARGYWQRPDLTATKFVRNPFSSDPAARLYKTGDLARRLHDGNIEYLGRIDDQIKIRGFRIEPGEIETVLQQHPTVQDVIVVARDHEPGRSSPLLKIDKQLVAYIVPKPSATPGASLTVDEVHRFLRQKMPEYMLPNAVVFMETLPVTPNGKIDRRALPSPDITQLEHEQGFVAPRTPTEEILAGAFSNVLGIAQIGIDDNYFVLGGDSIRSVMIAGRIQARGLDVSVADLHQYPTIRALAQAIDSKQTHYLEVPTTAPFSLISDEDRQRMPPNVEDAYPLNLLQEGMIFHRDFAPKSAVYHAIASIRLRAPFDLDVMRMVIQQLVERHPMLRTSFDQSNFSQALQLVHKTFKHPLFFEDLRDLPAEEREARVVGWVESEKQRGFELDEYPLIRFMVQPLTEDTFQFTYGFHHEIVDGWSEALMITELFSHYFSILNGEPIDIKLPGTTMRDAVALELQALAREDFKAFWTKYLEDATLMRLPRLFSALKADKGERKIVRIPVAITPEISDGTKRLARETAVPLKTVLLAAHMMVMCMYHGQNDTLTYTVTNGRPENPHGGGIIGLFVNSLALRVKMNGGTWIDLITQTLASEQASLPYRRLPMAELKRHQGNEPLAEALFFFTDYHVFQVLEKWGTVEHLDTILYGESTFPFCAIFRLNRVTSELEVRIEYDSLQFSADSMQDIADCYVNVLNAMIRNPHDRYENHCFLPEYEQRKMLVEWNQTSATYTQDRCIHHLFEAQAAQHPTAVALEYEDRHLSYAELNQYANQLAQQLRKRGVGPETLIGIYMERSPEMIVAILGVLKAGGAYIPLDPAYPQERLAAIIADTQAPVLITQEHLQARLGEQQAAIVTLDRDFTNLAHESAEAVQSGVQPQHLAYVIYTSGSTGQPKGVVVSHQSLVASTEARLNYYRDPASRFLLLSSFAFDSSIAGIFGTLCQGGTLVLPREGLQLEPVDLVKSIHQYRITHMLSVPSLYAPVLEQASAEQLESLQVVIVAGEPCPKELFEAHRKKLPDTAFFNEYGPTEATVWSTVWQGKPVEFRTLLPIGKPIANTQIYLLSQHLQPVPVGVTGELCIGGAGLARGYLNRPDLTAEKFIPNPFSTVPGERLYRTGDMARYLPDGQIEFLGRVDLQVKVRGFRVELGEIEAVIDRYPGVQRSVVLAREDTPGEKQLVAYVLPHENQTPTVGELQKFVKDKLPKYMVPASFVLLETLPLTPTGKIDRGALPAPERVRPDLASTFVAPRTKTEEVLAGIWCQVLSLPAVGVHDDFFDLGGESLRAMQVTTKLNKVFQTQLSVRMLFDNPTVESLTQCIEAARWAAQGRQPDSSGSNYEEGRL